MKFNIDAVKAHEAKITLAGFLFIAIGFYFLRAEMNPGPGEAVHTKHVYVFAGLMMMGGGFLFPAFLLKVLSLVVERLPTFGTRKTDVPLERAPEGTKPGTPVAQIDPAKVVKPEAPVLSPDLDKP